MYSLAVVEPSFTCAVDGPARAETALEAVQQLEQQVGPLLLLLDAEAANAALLAAAEPAPAVLAAIPRVQEHWQPPSPVALKHKMVSH